MENIMENKTEMNVKVMNRIKEKSYQILHMLDKNSEHAVEVNRELLMNIVRDNQNTRFGAEHHFNDITSPESYREHVPLSDYEDYAEAVRCMMEDGEENLITAYPVQYYAITGGTTGAPKNVPVTDRGIANIRDYASSIMPAVISEFYKNTKLEDVPDGFRLTLLSIFQRDLPNGSKTGFISASCLTDETMRLLPYLYSTPKDVLFSAEGTNLKYLHAFFGLSERSVSCFTGPYIPILLDFINYIKSEWPVLVRDIRRGVIAENIQIPDWLRQKLQSEISPNPERANELEKEFSQGFDNTILKRIWPKLSAVTAIWAGNFSSYARKLQEFTGRSIPYYTMSYSSSEGVFAVARHPFDQCYVMTPDTCFFEFIPVDSQKGGDDDANAATVFIDGVQEGKDYELIITNPSGFYRYRTGDVIRVVGFYNESPMIVFMYRKKNIVSIMGEHFTEDHLFNAVQEFERRTGLDIIDYCMYPDRDAAPVRYAIFLEPDSAVPAERLQEYTEIMQQELLRASSSYADYYADDVLGMPKLTFLQSQTFQLYREIKMYKSGISENQLKPVHVLTTPEMIRFFSGMVEQ